jgi:50S ribosomal subunit-associated GTPase HflX
VIALNKIDLIDPPHLENLRDDLDQTSLIVDHEVISISVKEKQHIDLLLQTIYQSIPHIVKIMFQLPMVEKSHAFISQLYEKAQVNHITYAKRIIVEVECNEKIKEKLIATCRALKGDVL